MIRQVTVYLDDNELETMDGAFRCGPVVCENLGGGEEVHNALLDNRGYWNLGELRAEVAALFRVPAEMVLLSA